MKAKPYISLAVAVWTLICSCKNENRKKYHSLKEKINAMTVVKKDTVLSEYNTNEYVEVQALQGVHRFLIPNREQAMTSYPCSSCHTLPMSKMKSPNHAVKRAHWTVKISHADRRVMSCLTCHNGDAMDTLKSLTGEAISYNKSHLLCSQCHTLQAKDWAGGAHGKRMEGWGSPRKSLTCVNCHNPHKPEIARRWPSRYNTSKLMMQEDKGMAEVKE